MEYKAGLTGHQKEALCIVTNPKELDALEEDLSIIDFGVPQCQKIKNIPEKPSRFQRKTKFGIDLVKLG